MQHVLHRQKQWLLKKRLNLGIEQKFQRVCVEMDSKELHIILTNRCKNIDWRIRPLIVDILELLKLIPEKKKEGLIKRKANAATNWVVVNAKRKMCTSGWVRNVSSLVRMICQHLLKDE